MTQPRQHKPLFGSIQQSRLPTPLGYETISERGVQYTGLGRSRVPLGVIRENEGDAGERVFGRKREIGEFCVVELD